MSVLPFPNLPYSIRGLRTYSTAALTVAFALTAGVACDEDASTEMRVLAAPTELGPAAGGEKPSLAADDITAMGTIPLPINQSVATTLPAPAFQIRQTGTGANGIFEISHTTSNQTSLEGRNRGLGRAGAFLIFNSANPSHAVVGHTSGRGSAGQFRIFNTINSLPAVSGQSDGSGPGVHGSNTGTGGAGVFQISNASNNRDVLVATTSGTGRAGRFQVSNSSNSIPALSAVTSGVGPAAHFESSHPGPGILGPALRVVATHNGRSLDVVQHGIGSAGAFFIDNTSSLGTALLLETRGPGRAFWVSQGRSQFDGDVTINGTLTKPAGSFRIDHPLDPDRKTLSHSFVESPDMMNVYNGNATLDANGRATVELPDYFEALNRDFRYQLTAIGSPGPNLYIAEGVKQNGFKIAGGRPYATVSWQVTGVRQDAYAEEHRIKVEEEKP